MSRYRLDIAAEHIVSTKRSILEIALETGFANQSYFQKLFREQYGITPYQYRLRHQPQKELNHQLQKLAKEYHLTKLKLAKLKSESSTDPLTGLNNRRLFDKRLSAEFKRFKSKGQKFTVMMLDIDYFKKINDTHGHQAGDATLKKMAALFSVNLRKDDLLARYGGEEFAVILSSAEPQSLLEKAKRINLAVQKLEVVFQKNHLRLTVSLGLATVNEKDFVGEDTVHRADQALYLAKKNGRNRVEVAE